MTNSLTTRTRKIDPLEAFKLFFIHGLTKADIARHFNAAKSSVIQVLKPFEDIISDPGKLEIFRAHKAELLHGIQLQILSSLADPEKLKKANLRDLALSFAIMYDKERLESGQSTANINYEDVSREYAEIKRALASLINESPGLHAHLESHKLLKVDTNGVAMRENVIEYQPVTPTEPLPTNQPSALSGDASGVIPTAPASPQGEGEGASGGTGSVLYPGRGYEKSKGATTRSKSKGSDKSSACGHGKAEKGSTARPAKYIAPSAAKAGVMLAKKGRSSSISKTSSGRKGRAGRKISKGRKKCSTN